MTPDERKKFDHEDSDQKILKDMMGLRAKYKKEMERAQYLKPEDLFHASYNIFKLQHAHFRFGRVDELQMSELIKKEFAIDIRFSVATSSQSSKLEDMTVIGDNWMIGKKPHCKHGLSMKAILRNFLQGNFNQVKLMAKLRHQRLSTPTSR